MKVYYTQLEVAEMANTSASYFSTCIRKGVVPAPSHQVGLRRFYDQEARDRIVKMFEDRRQMRIEILKNKQQGDQI